jgi:hypothetical protein
MSSSKSNIFIYEISIADKFWTKPKYIKQFHGENVSNISSIAKIALFSINESAIPWITDIN